ncbi:LysM peptidoglycan-binding domain-containing protein [Dethiosulfatarculus sandiegensis]|uniref:Lytic transglycosylase n=1 Tax=Dethiosulfatarculus sandiegensis TaxID=1429043 RepID=A0A0D2GI91_9BACT|nr:LysM peptidoglycan-binding domain-containing protein [Dethiosulfatarculus sandiegensis]KIX14532.1 lytic transglycosylase [Dethiosulfatarculus sandiegensis]
MTLSRITPRFLTLGLLLSLALAGCATTQQTAQQTEAEPKAIQKPRPPEKEIEAQIAQELKELAAKEITPSQKAEAADAKEPEVTYDIPITINKQVNYFLDYFQNRIPKRFQYWLSRSGRYVPMMTDILKQYGLPEDLVYLAMIESGFSCRAYSRAHAVGPWQFIRGTGKRYGLKINYWVDERRDPVKATHAAAQYLKALYEEFNSWYLAAAAYNAGEAKIRRALSRYKAENFWDISQRNRRYLKRETKQYVPKMIAAALIAKDPGKYGFEEIKYEPPLEFDTVKVHAGTSLSVAAKLAGVKSKELSHLNPELRRWSTPPGGGTYTLRIPKGKALAFNAAYAKLTPKQRAARARAVKVKVHRGDTLGRIAQSFGVRLSDLMAMNPRLNPRRLRIGQVVYVPPSGRSHVKSRNTVASSKGSKTRTVAYKAPHRNQRKIVHTVKRGDTLWDISLAYGLNYKQIKRWNGRRSNRLSPGQKLVLYVPQAKAESKVQPAVKSKTRPEAGKTINYRVRRGDSLWKIARRFNVTTSNLRRWNSLNSTRLTPGDLLKVRTGGS